MATTAKDTRDTETDSGYENQARRVARELGITVTAEFADDQTCPTWEGREERSRYATRPCGRVHGDKYAITIRRDSDKRHAITFDFWNSQNDSDVGKEPGYYDVLSSVGSDAQMPTDPDEIAEEFGPMRPSQAIAAAKFTERLQAFFTESERDKLAEIN